MNKFLFFFIVLLLSVAACLSAFGGDVPAASLQV